MTKRVTPDTVGFSLDDHVRRIRALEALQYKYTLLAVFDAGGAGLTTGIKGDVQLHRRYEILSWTLLADQAGAIVIDVWKDTYANYPPTNADSITGTSEPEIVATDDSATGDTTGWTNTIIEAGDTIRYNIDSVTDIDRITLALELLG